MGGVAGLGNGITCPATQETRDGYPRGFNAWRAPNWPKQRPRQAAQAVRLASPSSGDLSQAWALPSAFRRLFYRQPRAGQRPRHPRGGITASTPRTRMANPIRDDRTQHIAIAPPARSCIDFPHTRAYMPDRSDRVAGRRPSSPFARCEWARIDPGTRDCVGFARPAMGGHGSGF